jgi:hypothetical protein
MTTDERTRVLEELQEIQEISEINEVTSTTFTASSSTTVTSGAIYDAGVTYVGPVYMGTPVQTVNEEKPKAKAKAKAKAPDTNKYSTKDVSISGDDVLITTREDKRLTTMEFSTGRDRQSVEYLRRYSTDNVNFGSQDVFYFDKDFNYVEVTPTYNRRTSLIPSAKNFPRIRPNLVQNEVRKSYSKADNFSGYIIFDKKKFIESEGRIYKTRVRKDPNLEALKEFKKEIKQRFKKAKDFINFIRPMIKSIYDEENYEILYGINFDLKEYVSEVFLYLKFPNVTIKNSIEQEHLIEDLVVRLKISHDLTRIDDPKVFWMQKSLYMMRLTTNPIDACAGYAHSHLGNDGRSFSDCCIGDMNLFNTIGEEFSLFRSSTPTPISELEFESVLLGVHDFVYWESLEGGPHIKMENIVEKTGSELRENYNPFREMSSTHTLLTIIELARAIIKNGTGNVFKEVFVLVRKNGGFEFTIDKNRLYERFHEAFKKDQIAEIASNAGESVVKYNPVTKKFFHLRSSSRTWEDKITKGRTLVSKTVPIYMNGKVLRPQLVKYEKEPEKKDLEIDTVKPEIILRIANVILYHLTKELEEYVRTSKEEERRNT